MKILITGGTGLVGKALALALIGRGDDVMILTRSPVRAALHVPKTVRFLTALSEFTDFDGIDAVVNLAGEPIFARRWTREQKKQLRESRLALTQQLVEKINKSLSPPVFFSGSATGIYGDQGSYVITEQSPLASNFTAQLCQDWEFTAKQARTRVCLLRTGMVFSPNGGALAKMLPLYRWGFGGKLGSGEQYFPWISLADMVSAIIFLLDNPQCQGAYNLTAPVPVQQKILNQLLAKQCRRPAIAKVPAWLLKMILGERAGLILESQNVVPERLLKSGFKFEDNDVAGYFRNVDKF